MEFYEVYWELYKLELEKYLVQYRSGESPIKEIFEKIDKELSELYYDESFDDACLKQDFDRYVDAQNLLRKRNNLLIFPPRQRCISVVFERSNFGKEKSNA